VDHLRDVRLIIFDADGTLRRTTRKGLPCPNVPGEWELIPGVAEYLADLRRARPDLVFGIASDQGGVGLGYLSLDSARGMLEETARQAHGYQPPGPALQICPHAPREGCVCRKPAPKMLQRIAVYYFIGQERTLYVGDMESDRLAAERAGMQFEWAWEFFGWPRPDD
jgi:D-glycero-D-manno-heptose 1,7-bisphosphate phosphatase